MTEESVPTIKSVKSLCMSCGARTARLIRPHGAEGFSAKCVECENIDFVEARASGGIVNSQVMVTLYRTALEQEARLRRLEAIFEALDTDLLERLLREVRGRS